MNTSLESGMLAAISFVCSSLIMSLVPAMTKVFACIPVKQNKWKTPSLFYVKMLNVHKINRSYSSLHAPFLYPKLLPYPAYM